MLYNINWMSAYTPSLPPSPHLRYTAYGSFFMGVHKKRYRLVNRCMLYLCLHNYHDRSTGSSRWFNLLELQALQLPGKEENMYRVHGADKKVQDDAQNIEIAITKCQSNLDNMKDLVYEQQLSVHAWPWVPLTNITMIVPFGKCLLMYIILSFYLLSRPVCHTTTYCCSFYHALFHCSDNLPSSITYASSLYS